MVILSEDKASSLTVKVNEVEYSRYPSVNLFFAVADKGFCGEHDVWVEQDDVQSFLAQLHCCEQARQGQAVLSVPDELELSIEQSDGWGHFMLRYKFCRTSFASGQLITYNVAGMFRLDTELFAQTVYAISDLMTDAMPNLKVSEN